MKHAVLFLVVLLASCKPTPPAPPKPLGERLVEGHISELRLLPGETHVRFLADAKNPQAKETASSLRLGKLYLLNLHTRQLARVGQHVASLAGAQHATADGKYLLFLDDYNPTTKAGRLRCANVADATVGNALGEAVSFFIAAPMEQRLAFVDGGVLKVGRLPAGPFNTVAEEVVSAEFSQDGNTLAFKKRFEAGGQLWAVDLKEAGASSRLFAENAGDYRLSKDGKKLFFTARETLKEKAFRLFLSDTREGASSKQLSSEMFRFVLSPDERWVAYSETQTPERPGTLWVRPAAGGEAKKLGERVREFEFASDSGALAWREGFHGDEGSLAVVLLKGELEPRRLTSRTRHWQWNPQGNALAYTAMVSTPDASVSVDLFSFRLGDEAPTKMHAWVYEYAFSVDGESVLFEANCTREGRSCELLLAKAEAGEEAAKTKLAEGVFSFRQSADGQRVYWLHVTPLKPVHTQLWAADMANLRPQKLAENVHLPPPLPVDKTGKKFLYISNQLRHEGLYLTELK